MTKKANNGGGRKRRLLGVGLWLGLSCFVASAPSHAATRLILRVESGQPLLPVVCSLLGCTVQDQLGDPDGDLFLVTFPTNLRIDLLTDILTDILGRHVDVEEDTLGQTLGATQTGVPPALLDKTPVHYYGNTVREGYVTQPAAQIVGIANTHSTFNVRGSGIVAVIDTGVDSTHPVLQNVLVAGYDFTRRQAGFADEKADLQQSTTAVVDQSTTAVVDQSTTAVVDSYTASQLNQPQYRAFGHGTMVAGVVHLVAPGAMIMPLKAFHADGTGYASDVIKAIYFAVHHHARILNMSFSFPSTSHALSRALDYAKRKGVISVAATGNDGLQTTVYPAGYSGAVMGIASTSNTDTRSTFSNYGPSMTWLAAPGEAVVTLYPFGTYAATWGTSFSVPFVSGAAALLLDVPGLCTESQASQALSHAKYINNQLGNGRLDLYQAVQAFRQSLGFR